MVWSIDADDAKMLLDIPIPMIYVIIDQLALNLVDACLENKLQILLKSLLFFAKIRKVDYSKITKICHFENKYVISCLETRFRLL